MAQRRMFSKAITETGDFYGMSEGAQALYFHIGMIADDDGFADCFYLTSLFDDGHAKLEELEDGGFIRRLPVKGNVVYVPDWTVNNQIKSDRYVASKYKEYLLNLDDWMTGNQAATIGIPNGTKMEPKWNQNGTTV